MKKLHLFVLKAFIGPFLLTFLISNFLFLMIWLFKYIEDMVGKGLDISVILELIAYASVNQFPMALPLSMLLSSIMTLGNLGESNELVAAKSLGVSLQQFIKPLMILTFFISIFAFITSNNIIPVTSLKARTLLRDIHKKSPELNIPEGVFYDQIANFNIYVDKKDPDGTLHHLIIHDHSTSLKNNNVTIAESGRMKSGKNKDKLYVTLFNGYSVNEEHYAKGSKKLTYPFMTSEFEKQEFIIELDNSELERSDGSIFKKQSAMLTFPQLVEGIDSLQRMKARTAYKSTQQINDIYFFKKDSLINYDSIAALAVNTYPTLDSISLKTKKKVIDHATQLARGMKAKIDNVEKSYKAKNYHIVKYDMEFHKKFTLAVSCLVLFFIGAPFGAITRKGGLAWPIIYSVILFIIYWVLNITFQKLAKNGTVLMFWGMWMANIVLFPVGLYFTTRATKDLPMFSLKLFKRK